MTGEAFFGELKDGIVFNVSIRLCRKLLQKEPLILRLFQEYVSFEICVGVNGRIWINSNDIKNTIILMNSIKKSEYMSD